MLPFISVRGVYARKLSTKPLNILFFGSDEFSAYALRSLVKLKHKQVIDSIQVVSRPPKWCGRKKSVLKSPEIVQYAQDLRLDQPIHVDSNEEMLQLSSLCESQKIDMIIAVSFGKLIPNGLIGRVPYSLNVHPSLLPRYRGSAPLQHTLLNQDQYTGVTVQTLHPTKFDHGSIVAQSNPLPVSDLLASRPLPPLINQEDTRPPKLAKLMDQLGIVGGNLLADVLEKRTYQDPVSHIESNYEPSYAPRIKTEDKMINWNDSATDLLNRLQTLGPLYTFKRVQLKSKSPLSLKRVLIHDFDVIERVISNQTCGTFTQDNHDSITIACGCNTAILIKKLQFEACAIETPEQFMKKLPKRCGKTLANELVFVNET
ncbi:uncharacterized protein HLK63_E02651 [Nakaseomyces glabratus]|nr:Methionyl-tRNA formyltransferase [Nakaseomyces glabratus]UCS19795.1 uncharacterized protein GW608_E02651 [Nakaseomyces glabratus]UCS25027.1 uncharacterized protein HLK63_E02651 [Nakaseomyces glabratus]UCS30257.1 uncharacterized protein HLK64_E02651 [Nakaseomyces glabratus]UCS35486.1 uncharacterized protein HLK62_E02651 [Nakaseomyces glabratus]